jgi:hypothetical protein
MSENRENTEETEEGSSDITERPMVIFHRYNDRTNRLSSVLLERTPNVTTMNTDDFVLDYNSMATNLLLNIITSTPINNLQRTLPLLPPSNSSNFWDPVKIGLTLKQAQEIPVYSLEDNCLICAEQKSKWRKLPCSEKHSICDKCFVEWFSENVKCPFCKQDLREFIMRNNVEE